MKSYHHMCCSWCNGRGSKFDTFNITAILAEFLHIFAPHKTENVRTTTRHNITSWNFAGIFFGTSSFQSCVCSLHYQHCHVTSFKFPTAQVSIGVYAYTFTWNICTGVLFALSCFFIGDVTNSGLHTAFFTFSILSVPDSFRDLSHYLILNLCKII